MFAEGSLEGCQKGSAASQPENELEPLDRECKHILLSGLDSTMMSYRTLRLGL